MSNERDCEHGRQVGHCPECDVFELEQENRLLRARNERLERELANVTGGREEPAATLTTWVSETEAVTEPLFKAPHRLTDSEVSEVWFAAKIPGLSETNARLLIRAAEERARKK
jgi:hypothetical protein